MDVYDAASDLGQLRAIFVLIIGGIISICLLVFSIIMFTKSNKNYLEVNGVISDATCINQIINNQMTWNCNLVIRYNINDQNYNKSIQTYSNTEYQPLQNILIYYEDGNPNNISITKPLKSKTAAIILLLSAIFVGCLIGVNWYLTKHSKLYSAVSGASTFFGR